MTEHAGWRRRDFVSGLLTMGAGSLLGFERIVSAMPLATPGAKTGPECRADGAGMEICEARACTFLASVAPKAQENSNWCWAACLEMSFSCLSHRVDQQTIVRAAWGDIRNVPAAPAEIVRSVQREYVDAFGSRFRLRARLLDRTITIITDVAAIGQTFEHVAAGKPAIVGTINPDGSGHATMLTSLTVRRSTDRKSSPEFRAAGVYDPWPGRERRAFTLEDWTRTPYIILVDV
jgi:hypothetical protein